MKKQNILISGKSKKVIFLPFIILIFLGFSFTQANAQKYCIPNGGFPKALTEVFVADAGMRGFEIIQNMKISHSKSLYLDFTNMYVEAVAGGRINHKMAFTIRPAYFTIWVDWDNNGFDAGDIMLSDQFPSKNPPIYVVPPKTKPGDYRMRIRVAMKAEPKDPCKNNTTIITGETQDYTVRILARTDAAIDSLVSPDTSNYLCSSEQDIKVRIANQGVDDLKQAKVNWSLNGVTQSPQTMNFNPPLKHGDDKTVTITTQNFQLNTPIAIQVWTDDPNGATDENNANDTIGFKMNVNEADAEITPGDTTICEGTPLTLNSGNSNSSATTKWSDGSSKDNINVNASGQYYVTVTDGNCSSTDTVDITVDPQPHASSIQSLPQNNSSFEFIANGISAVSNYSWDFGDGNNSTSQYPNHQYAHSGTYTVTLIVENYCGADTATTTVNYRALGIAQNQLNKQLQLYPNPASNVVILKTENDKKIASVAVYNMLGQEVYQHTINDRSTYQLDVNNYSSGIYSISIEMTDGTSMQRKFQVTK